MQAPATRCPKCQRELTKRSMTRHLQSCLGPGDALHVLVEGRDEPEYWLHVALSPASTLRDLDSLLRNTWLECCGHMSQFTIEGQAYTSTVDRDGWGPPSRSMATRISDALTPGMKFTYDYDFGSTTRLKGKLVGTIGRPGKSKVTIIARNAPLLWTCEKCGAAATGLCPGCSMLSCDECENEPCHCGSRWADPMRVVNSPRMGVCGYEG